LNDTSYFYERDYPVPTLKRRRCDLKFICGAPNLDDSFENKAFNFSDVIPTNFSALHFSFTKTAIIANEQGTSSTNYPLFSYVVRRANAK
jgi:hypothetical protein